MNLLRGFLGIVFPRPKYLTLWLVPALLCALSDCSKAQSENSDAPASRREERPQGAAGTEASWIVQSVTGEIVRLAEYAAKVDSSAFPPNLTAVTTLPSDAAGCHYTVETHLPNQEALKTTIDIPGAIWDPQAYVAFTKEVFARLSLDKQKQLGSIGGNPLASLTTPRVEVIQQENKRVSQWLTAHPLDAAAHEQAALILGTLGMRENSGSFFDPRVLCNRATAHLALARTLRAGQPQSDCGEVGELLVGLLIDTKADCEKRIDALAARIGSAPELKNSELAGKYGEMEKKVFPNKPRAVALSDFTGPPEHGVLIPVSNEVVAGAGLKASDIIVAIDGKKVDSIEQYTFIRELTDSDEMDFIVYSDGKYRAVHATVPGRRFEIPFETYNP